MAFSFSITSRSLFMRHSACCFSSERLFNSLSLPPNTLPLQSALFSFRILPLKPAHSPVSVTGLLLKPPHLPAEHQISQRNILSFISGLIPNLIPHPIPCLIPNLQQRRSAAIHVRQPCPATMSGNHVRQPRPATMSGNHVRQNTPRSHCAAV